MQRLRELMRDEGLDGFNEVCAPSLLGNEGYFLAELTDVGGAAEIIPAGNLTWSEDAGAVIREGELIHPVKYLTGFEGGVRIS